MSNLVSIKGRYGEGGGAMPGCAGWSKVVNHLLESHYSSHLLTDDRLHTHATSSIVCLSVRPFVPFYLLNRLTFELCYGSPGIESQGHRSRSRTRVRVEY